MSYTKLVDSTMTDTKKRNFKPRAKKDDDMSASPDMKKSKSVKYFNNKSVKLIEDLVDENFLENFDFVKVQNQDKIYYLVQPSPDKPDVKVKGQDIYTPESDTPTGIMLQKANEKVDKEGYSYGITLSDDQVEKFFIFHDRVIDYLLTNRQDFNKEKMFQDFDEDWTDDQVRKQIKKKWTAHVNKAQPNKKDPTKMNKPGAFIKVRPDKENRLQVTIKDSDDSILHWVPQKPYENSNGPDGKPISAEEYKRRLDVYEQAITDYNSKWENRQQVADLVGPHSNNDVVWSILGISFSVGTWSYVISLREIRRVKLSERKPFVPRDANQPPTSNMPARKPTKVVEETKVNEDDQEDVNEEDDHDGNDMGDDDNDNNVEVTDE